MFIVLFYSFILDLFYSFIVLSCSVLKQYTVSSTAQFTVNTLLLGRYSDFTSS